MKNPGSTSTKSRLKARKIIYLGIRGGCAGWQFPMEWGEGDEFLDKVGMARSTFEGRRGREARC